MSTSDIIRTVGSAVTIAVALVTLVWFAANLNGRVGRLEEQVHTLTVAPIIANPSNVGDISGSASRTVQNPVADICAKLALQAAESIKAGHEVTEAEPVQEMMRKLGCIAK